MWTLRLGSPVTGPALFAGLALTALACGPAAAQYDVPYVPTPQPVVDAMLEMGQVDKDDYLIDLGSGDGRIVVTAAERYGTRGMGVDLNPERIAESEANAEQAGVTDLVEFKQQDLFETDISKADVLTMYLLSSVNLRLRPVILDTLEPGTRVVSHAFDMGDWQPDEERRVENKRIMSWIVPAKVEGAWKIKDDQGERTVTMDQLYQVLTVSAEDAEGSGRLTGREIMLVLAGSDGGSREYTGTVDGDSMSGTTADGGQWTAERVDTGNETSQAGGGDADQSGSGN